MHKVIRLAGFLNGIILTAALHVSAAKENMKAIKY